MESEVAEKKLPWYARDYKGATNFTYGDADYPHQCLASAFVVLDQVQAAIRAALKQSWEMPLDDQKALLAVVKEMRDKLDGTAKYLDAVERSIKP